MRIQGILILASSIVTINPAMAGYETALGVLSKTAYDRGSSLAIGDTLDVMDPSTPKQRCVNYSESDVKPDSTGALASSVKISYHSDLHQFENNFDVSWNAEAHASANLAGIAQAGGTLKNFGKFSNYLALDREGALIVVEATALHGRDFIQNWSLKPEYQKLIDEQRFDDFRSSCGTHFVRGWNRRSGVNIYITVSHSNSVINTIVQNSLEASANSSMSIPEVGQADLKSTVSTSLADALKLITKIGSYQAKAEAVGGYGLETISPIISGQDLSNPAEIAKLLDAIADKAKDFTYANSAPDEFVLVAFPQLSPKNVKFDEKNYAKLGNIYRALVTVDQRVQLYQTYKKTDPNLWNSYFKVENDKITSLRDQLVAAYGNCRDNGTCDYEVPEQIDGLIISDLFKSGSLDSSCMYTYNHADKAGDQTVEAFNYLSSIALLWRSQLNFFDQIDWASVEVFVINPAFSMSKISFDPAKRQRIIDHGVDNKSVFIDVYRENIAPGRFDVDGKFSVDAIRDLRSNIAQSIFLLAYRSLSGQVITETLGRPNMQNCPAYVSQQ